MTRTIEVLGGNAVLESKVRNDFELVLLIKKGLPVEAFKYLAKNTEFKPDALEQIVSRRTIGRRLRLTPEMSDRLIRYANVWAKSVETFGSTDKARRWLFHSNRSLRGSTPFAMVDTESGARLVEDVLGRISHGVYS